MCQKSCADNHYCDIKKNTQGVWYDKTIVVSINSKNPKNRTHPTTFWSLPTKNSQCPNIYRPERLIMRKIAKISLLNSFLFAIPFMTGINFLIFIFFCECIALKCQQCYLLRLTTWSLNSFSYTKNWIFCFFGTWMKREWLKEKKETWWKQIKVAEIIAVIYI